MLLLENMCLHSGAYVQAYAIPAIVVSGSKSDVAIGKNYLLWMQVRFFLYGAIMI
jgi:hypothetical protein